MTNDHVCTEGIILRAIPFQEFHRILTVFTSESGLIKVFVSNFGQSSAAKNNFFQPFSRIEIILTKGKGDLYYYKDGTLIENYYTRCLPELANHYLHGAAGIAKALLLSQLAGKAAPKLFLLLDAYLKNLATSGASQSLISSFQLKLLVHDGLLSTETCCSECSKELPSLRIAACGGFYCQEHAPANSFSLSEAESKMLLLLTTSRSLAEITAQDLQANFSSKVSHLFELAIQS